MERLAINPSAGNRHDAVPRYSAGRESIHHLVYRIEVGDVIFLFGERRTVFPAQPEIERQVGSTFQSSCA